MQPRSDGSQTIDCHAHAVPAGLLDRLTARDGSEGVTAREVDQGWMVTLPGQDARLVRPKMFRPELRSAWRDEQGIDVQLLLPWFDLQPTAAMAGESARLWARRINEALLEEVGGRTGDGRAPALATVALADIDEAVADLDAAVNGDGMAGLILSTNPVHCADLADPRLDRLWASAAELHVPVMLHPPSDGPARELPGSEQFGNAYCRLVDTSFAVAKLILSGVLDRHPDLRLVTVHGGGFLPFQGLRLDGAHRADALAAYELERGAPSAYFGDLYYDTVAMSSSAIGFLAETVGSAQVLLGTDYPFPIGDPAPVSRVREAGLGDADTDAVLGGNAADLITGSKRG
jgi:aminocarboxymuconate-semialdehyde decarboxylase